MYSQINYLQIAFSAISKFPTKYTYKSKTMAMTCGLITVFGDYSTFISLCSQDQTEQQPRKRVAVPHQRTAPKATLNVNIFSLHIATEAFFSAYSKQKGRETISMFYDNAGLTFYLFTSSPLAKLNLVFVTHLKCKSATQTCSSQDGGSSALPCKHSCPLGGCRYITRAI